MQILPGLESGKYYHIYNRGNNGENIFIEDKNYGHFLRLYERHITPVADTFAYCLMRNHFHLLVRIKDLQGFQNLEGLKQADPTNQFSKLFNAYAKAINKTYRRTGSLFEKRFRRKEITSPKYFSRLICYIHANPRKHGFVNDYRNYPYSSYQILLSHVPTVLHRDEVVEWFGSKQIFMNVHQQEIDEKEIFMYIDDDVDC